MPKFEGQHNSEFLVSEGNGEISREEGVLAAGLTVEDGTLMSFSGGELVPLTNGNSANFAGIILGKHDTSSDGPEGNATKRVAYIAREAEVDADLIHFPDNAAANVTTQLANKFIVRR